MPDLSEQTRNIVAVELQIERERVTPGAALADLGMDSVSALNILFAVEEQFRLSQIDVAELAQIKTIGDLQNIVAQLLSAQTESEPAGR